MLSCDYRELLAGALLVAIGGFVGVYALANYPLGTLRHMGPGMFPASLGFILAGIGVAIFLPALFRRAPGLPKPAFRPFVAILSGGLIFAFGVTSFGMVPGVVVLVIAAALADDKLGVVGTLALTLVLCVLTILIFKIGLGVPLDAVRWPF